MLSSTATNTGIDFELWNFIIAVAAFLLALYSVWITKSGNRCKIDIDSCFYDRHRTEPYLAGFSINNVSSVSTKIIAIDFFDSSGMIITPLLGYEPSPRMEGRGMLAQPEILTLYDFESILEVGEVLQPHSKIDYRYFLSDLPKPLVIKVTCDKRVRWFKKSESFSVTFTKN